MRHLAFLLLAWLALAGCDRPIVEPLPVEIEVVSADLGVVRLEPRLPLALRAGRFGTVTRLRVADRDAARDEAADVFRDTLDLAVGLNAIPVRAFDGDREVLVDTLYAVYLPITRLGGVGVSDTPRTAAASARLLDGRALVSGGAGPTGTAIASLDVLSPSGGSVTTETRPLLVARAGHAATVLPDGQVLLLGGASVAAPSRLADFVTRAEVVAPDGSATRSVAVEGGSLLRAFHSARALQRDGRIYVYVFGGLQPAQIGAAPVGTVAILEWLDGPEPRLRLLSPSLGAGAFPALESHVQIDVPARSGMAATSVVLGDRASFVFEWRVPGTLYPFDLRRSALPEPDAPRTGAAAVALGDGVTLLVGGRTPTGAALGRVEVYADAARRLFALPESLWLGVPRYGHAATILGGGRMAVLGGTASSGSPAAAIEIYDL
jgi:hypothetical protein